MSSISSFLWDKIKGNFPLVVKYNLERNSNDEYTYINSLPVNFNPQLSFSTINYELNSIHIKRHIQDKFRYTHDSGKFKLEILPGGDYHGLSEDAKTITYALSFVIVGSGEFRKENYKDYEKYVELIFNGYDKREAKSMFLLDTTIANSDNSRGSLTKAAR